MNIKDYNKKVRGKGNVEMSLYEINQSIISQLPKYTAEQHADLISRINEWATFDTEYYMLLCRDINYYTIFHFNPEDSEFDTLGAGVNLLLQEVGFTIHSDEILDKHCEIWGKNDNGTYAFMLFPYDEGVINYG